MIFAIETLQKLGYTFSINEKGEIVARGKRSEQAEAALALLRSDRAKAALCLQNWEEFRKKKRAFRIAFDFFQAHFPPTMEEAYWLKAAEDLGTACAQAEAEPFAVELLVWVCLQLEKLAPEGEGA